MICAAHAVNAVHAVINVVLAIVIVRKNLENGSNHICIKDFMKTFPFDINCFIKMY